MPDISNNAETKHNPEDLISNIKREAAEDFAHADEYAMLNYGIELQAVVREAFMAGVIYKRGKMSDATN